MSTPTRVLTTLAAGTTLVGALAAVWLNAPVPPPAEPATAVVTPAVIPDAARAPAPGTPSTAATQAALVRTSCEFVAGQRLAYAVRLDSTVQQQVSGVAEPVRTSVDLEARLNLQVVSTAGTSAVLVGQLADLSHDRATGLDLAALGTPFLVEIDGACQLQNFARARTVGRTAARQQQGLLWDTQFRLVASQDAFVTHNANGVVQSTLTGAGDVVRRELTRYVHLWGSRDGAPARGTLDVTLGAGPWFASLTSHEDFSAEQTSGTSSLSMTALPRATVDFTPAQLDVQHYAWENLLPRLATQVVQRPVTSFDTARQQRVATQTPTEALDGFAERVTKGLGVQSTWPDLSAYFEAHPEAIAPSLARYFKGELPENAAGDFFLALGKARTTVARDALLGIRRDARSAVMDRVRANFALVDREDVGLAYAHELSKDVATHLTAADDANRFLSRESLLALSTMSGMRNDVEVSLVSRQAIEQALQSPKLEVIQVAMGAIANMGDPALLTVADPYIHSDDVDTRLLAAKVFRRMPPVLTDDVEAAWLARETHPFVKKELYKHLQRQHHELSGANRTLVNQALADLPTSKSALTRRHIVRLLNESLASKDPDVRAALKAQAKVEFANRSTLLNEFSRILTRDEVAEVLR